MRSRESGSGGILLNSLGATFQGIQAIFGDPDAIQDNENDRAYGPDDYWGWAGLLRWCYFKGLPDGLDRLLQGGRFSEVGVFFSEGRAVKIELCVGCPTFQSGPVGCVPSHCPVDFRRGNYEDQLNAFKLFLQQGPRLRDVLPLPLIADLRFHDFSEDMRCKGWLEKTAFCQWPVNMRLNGTMSSGAMKSHFQCIIPRSFIRKKLDTTTGKFLYGVLDEKSMAPSRWLKPPGSEIWAPSKEGADSAQVCDLRLADSLVFYFNMHLIPPSENKAQESGDLDISTPIQEDPQASRKKKWWWF